jgi:acetolactate decarboxylase
MIRKREMLVLQGSRLFIVALGVIVVFIAGYLAGGGQTSSIPSRDQDLLYQVSTYTALAGGGFGPVEPVKALMGNGDLGLGTFEGLDGEMVVVDGTCYQVKSDGTARPADLALGVPFAGVTFFSPDLSVPGVVAGNLTELMGFLDSQIPSRDLFYAIRITGNFSYVRARSVPAQAKPYTPLTDALKGQTIYEFRNVTGTAVGFYTPASAAGLNFPGYHLHFITADRSRGGHILDIATGGDMIEMDSTPRYTVHLAPGVPSSNGSEG